MAHITLPEGIPGIGGPLRAYPDTARHLLGLAQALLRGPSSLTPGERETIATFTSARNQCNFCTRSHQATAQHLLDAEGSAVASALDLVRADPESAPLDEKMKALLAIAAGVQQGGRGCVSDAAVERARAAGADDKAIHDTVLIAAAFCMYNRYVDGLDTLSPIDDALYDQMGKGLAEHGYARS
jgi:uncharacterized peroxidase-related enzyme